MISIVCSNCQVSLTIDDAFAGGVCRCQHCGAIQTVPRTARAGITANGDTVSGAATSKTLWRGKGVSEGAAGTGLDDLADVVASSGLAGSGLRSGRLRRPAQVAAGKSPKKMLLAAAGALLLAVIAAVALWLTNGKEGASPAVDTTGQVQSGKVGPVIPAEVEGPSFAGLKLAGSTVIYILDRGSGTSSVFGQLKSLTQKSVTTLGNDRKFQVIFWTVRDETTAYPESGPTIAGDISQGELARKLDDVSAFGSSSVGPAMAMAAKAKPDLIVLVTGKGDDLDDAFIAEVESARPPNVPIDTIAAGSTHTIDALSQIAKKSGGQYRTLDDAALAKLGE